MAERSAAGPSLTPFAACGAVAVGVLAAAAIGRRDSPTDANPAIRDWYAALDKPGFTPPPVLFGIAWPLIEMALAAGGYRLLRAPRSPARDAALALLVAHQAGLAGWNALFFGARRLGAGSVAAGGLCVAAAGYAALARRTDRLAGASALPLTAWLGFATLLADAVRRRNPTP